MKAEQEARRQEQQGIGRQKRGFCSPEGAGVV